MKLIRPETIGDAQLDASNVPETPPAAWAGGTTYGLAATAGIVAGTVVTVYESLQAGNTGNAPATSPLWWRAIATTYALYDAGITYALNAIVISVATHREYQSLQAANLAHPLTDLAWWLDLGPTNRWRMFDQSNSSMTTRAAAIAVEVAITGRADGVALLNIVGNEVRIQMATVSSGAIYDQTFSLVSDSGVNDWYEYFFEPIVRRGDLVVTGLPLNADPSFTITLTEPGGVASMGALVIGQSKYFGETIHPLRLGIQDFSRKEQDEFGNFTLIERNYAKRQTAKVAVDEDRIDALATTLADYRATNVVWVGVDSYASTWLYGWYRDFSFDLSAPRETYLNIELEGLT